ncbi:MAG: HAMP domain-containing protein [Nitrospirae bacterium]|nr:HAMP domain-containing protein [Nitrospirota bacterium]
MQKKIIIAIIFYVIVIMVTLGIISDLAVNESIKSSLQNRLALARTIANNVDFFLQRNLGKLEDVSNSGKINLRDSDMRSKERILETIYRYSLFTDGVFLLDEHGNEVMTYPPRFGYFSNLTYINDVNRVLRDGRPVISNVYTVEPIKKKVIFIMAPLKDGEGKISGVVGGILGPADHFVNMLLKSGKVGSNSYIELIDSNEIVLASDNPSRLFQHHDHEGMLGRMILEGRDGILECRHGFSHPDAEKKPVDRLAFVPLSTAKWGVIVGQDERDIFGPAIGLKRMFFVLVFIFIGTSLVFSIGISMSIVKPLRSLMSSTNKIASGDLLTPVGKLGGDEILMLSKSIDDMRKKLAESVESIKNQNIELEDRVAERTGQIRESRRQVKHLLKKVISSQEEERTRIARGIHDTILQDLSAFLIKLDICRLQPDRVTIGKIDEMRNIVIETMDNVHSVIKDLRPSILDDFGIDASITWLMKNHLAEKGINFYFDVDFPDERRLSPEVEITLFRILQEAIINIKRHANAENVFVSLEVGDAFIEISVEDDGCGFDVDKLMGHPVEGGRGLGIIGMKERASLLGGNLFVYTKPGWGTRICMQIPLNGTVEDV